jgi:hypothetical protein
MMVIMTAGLFNCSTIELVFIGQFVGFLVGFNVGLLVGRFAVTIVFDGAKARLMLSTPAKDDMIP